MPKQKTHKGLNKRVKVTATGKIKRSKCNGSHLMSGTTGRMGRKIGTSTIVEGVRAKKMRALLNK